MPKPKSSSAFRTIGEVASEVGVSPHVLRFWESKFTQIKPHKRRGGHRYYRPTDVDIIAEIKSLLYDRGFTIKGAQQFLKEQKAVGSDEEQSTLFEGEATAPLELTTPAPGTITLPAGVDKAAVQAFIEELQDIKKLLRSEAA